MKKLAAFFHSLMRFKIKLSVQKMDTGLSVLNDVQGQEGRG